MTLTDLQSLTEVQRDALREAANIGAAHAATALSLMTGIRIMISVPMLTVATLDDLASLIAPADDEVVLVPMEMTGGLHGHTILAFPITTAHRLAALMLRQEMMGSQALTDMEASALTEAGNILAGAYLTALSEFLRMTLLPSPPSLAVGPAHDVMAQAAIAIGHKDGFAFCVETQFLVDNVSGTLPGYFLLLPDGASLGSMLAAVRVS